MKIVLFEPQIPQNTGNIIRTCAVTGTSLYIVSPQFDMSDKALKRAGLDYHNQVDIQIFENIEEVLAPGYKNIYFLSSKGEKIYSEITFNEDDMLVFGSESNGLPLTLRSEFKESFFRIPMRNGSRCLNLATSVGIVLYEGLRQTHFNQLHLP